MPASPPDYTPQLTQIVQALSHQDAFPSWLTGLIGVVVGFLLSLLAEPIRIALAKRRIETAIIREISAMIFTLRNFSPKDQDAAPPTFMSERYDYYFDRNRDAVLRIKGCDIIGDFYREIRQISTGSLKELGKPFERLEAVANHTSILSPRLRKRLGKRLTDLKAHTHIQAFPFVTGQGGVSS
jgi:hypothetical protein